MNDVRTQAALTLQKTAEGGYTSLMIHKVLETQGAAWKEADKRLYTNLVYTTLRRRAQIDEVLSKYSRTRVDKLDRYVRCCLEMGICQLLMMDSIQPYAAVNETVEAVKASRSYRYAGFVNAVLRNVQRHEKPIPSESGQVLVWLKDDIKADYGEEWAERYERQTAMTPLVCLRVNTLKISKEALQERLLKEEAGVEIVQEGCLVPEAFYVRHLSSIARLPSYQEGLFVIQDESSMAAAAALSCVSGDTVLDICAAPGGKTTMMAQRMKDTGRIESRDIHPHRVKLIQENCERLGLTCVFPMVGNAATASPEDEERFDKVLADVPCSGYGIVRSKPDILQHRSKEEVSELEKTQRQILENAGRAVKKGGRLVYSTCTLRRAENEAQVEAFLHRHPDFHPSAFGEDLLKALEKDEDCLMEGPGMAVLFPRPDGHEGFFIAVMERDQ